MPEVGGSPKFSSLGIATISGVSALTLSAFGLAEFNRHSIAEASKQIPSGPSIETANLSRADFSGRQITSDCQNLVSSFGSVCARIRTILQDGSVKDSEVLELRQLSNELRSDIPGVLEQLNKRWLVKFPEATHESSSVGIEDPIGAMLSKLPPPSTNLWTAIKDNFPPISKVDGYLSDLHYDFMGVPNINELHIYDGTNAVNFEAAKLSAEHLKRIELAAFPKVIQSAKQYCIAGSDCLINIRLDSPGTPDLKQVDKFARDSTILGATLFTLQKLAERVEPAQLASK